MLGVPQRSVLTTPRLIDGRAQLDGVVSSGHGGASNRRIVTLTTALTRVSVRGSGAVDRLSTDSSAPLGAGRTRLSPATFLRDLRSRGTLGDLSVSTVRNGGGLVRVVAHRASVSVAVTHGDGGSQEAGGKDRFPVVASGIVKVPVSNTTHRMPLEMPPSIAIFETTVGQRVGGFSGGVP